MEQELPAGTPPDLSAEEILRVINDKNMSLALLECATQAIISIDVQERIFLASRRAVEMFGYTRRELIGSQINILFPGSTHFRHCPQQENYLGYPMTSQVGTVIALTGRRIDGTDFPVEVGVSYLEGAQGKYAIAFITDISERKALEEQVSHARHVEALGRLVAGVAHDFNNMLGVISGYYFLILNKLSPRDAIREYVQAAIKAVDSTMGLTNQLLSFSRRQTIRPRIISLSAVVEQMQKLLRRLIGEDIELTLQLNSTCRQIFSDPTQIEQIVVNLVLNAKDAMPNGGRITIQTENVYLDESYAQTHEGVKPGEFVMLAITDTGQGMDLETRRQIFEPFFTTKPEGKSTGLALATVHRAVKQNGGAICVQSQLGSGTKFELYFPKAVAECTAGSA